MKPSSIPRFTVKRLMIAVAIVALGLGGFVWGRVLLDRRSRYQSEANRQRDYVKLAERAVEDDPPAVREKFGPAYRAMASYHAGREAKYRWAADHPWVVVETDHDPPVDPRTGYPFMMEDPFDYK